MRLGLRMAIGLGRAALIGLMLGTILTQAQTASSYERAYPQSKGTVEKALKSIQSNLAGRLPTLDGFAKPGEQPLDHYSRGYFQSAVEVSSTGSGGCIVRVASKVTAWYTDPAGAHSGYQLLISNGRLEADLLDQLSDEVAKSAPGAENRTAAAAQVVAPAPAPVRPAVAAAALPAPVAATSKPAMEAKKG